VHSTAAVRSLLCFQGVLQQANPSLGVPLSTTWSLKLQCAALRAYYLSLVQGNGFITDSNIISKYGLSDANPFFSALWDKPYVGMVSCMKLCAVQPRAPYGVCMIMTGSLLIRQCTFTRMQ
jgi:hypothetical protein